MKLRVAVFIFLASACVFILTPVLLDDIGGEPDTTPASGYDSVQDDGTMQTPDRSQSTPPATPDTVPQPPDTLPSSTPDPTPGPMPAEDITDTLTVTLPGGLSADVLLDRDYATKRTFQTETSIEITAYEPIYSLYVIWDKPPGEWHAAGGEGTDVFGKDGFIHEYVTLSSPSAEISINTPPGGAVLCDIYAFTEGYPPDTVQVWQTPLEKADLLILPAHADDEHLFFVGVMPYYARERGYDVQVAYMTNHQNEPLRPHELLNGLWTVGIRNYPVISSFNDRYAETLQDARNIYGQSNIVDYQVELLRRFKPSVVLGHDLNGEYGHGMHMLSAHALVEAVEKAADAGYHETSAERYGIWDTPKLYLHLYNENAIIMDWDIPLSSFGGASARDMAALGYECHISQHVWSFSVPPAGTTGTGSKFGLVRSLAGPDIKGGDMFENIT